VPHVGTLVQKTKASHANDDADMDVDMDDDDDAAGSSAKAEGTGFEIHVQPTSHAAVNWFTSCKRPLIYARYLFASCRLVRVAASDDGFNVRDLADLICEQASVGTMIKTEGEVLSRKVDFVSVDEADGHAVLRYDDG